MLKTINDIVKDFSYEKIGVEDPYDFLKNCRSGDADAQNMNYPKNGQIDRPDLVLFRLDEITFEKESPRQEALENVLASLNGISGINFVYLILGKKEGVNFYFGLSRELREDISINLREWGESVLKPSLEGNFRGSSVHLLSDPEQDDIVKLISDPSRENFATLEGIPGINQDAEKKNFQGVDRMVDVMLGDVFGFMVIAHPISREGDAQRIENDLYAIYDKLSYAAKQNIQCATNRSEQNGTTKTIGKGATDTEGYSSAATTNVGESYSKNVSIGKNDGTNHSRTEGYSPGGGGDNWSEANDESSGTSETGGETTGNSSGESLSNTHNISYASQTNESVAVNKGGQQGSSETISLEIMHKKVQEWIKYFDESVFPLLDYGRGKGMFVTSTLLWADNERVLRKLVNTAKGLFSGEEGNHVPLKGNFEINGNKHRLNSLRFFQQPVSKNAIPRDSRDWFQEIIWQHSYISDGSDSRFYLGNWLSVKELAIIAGIPQKEVVGLKLKEEVEFGLNVTNDGKKEEELIDIGNLVVSGNEKALPVYIPASDFDRHIFVTGVTGAGKTVTCKNLLISSGLSFLVIEPAKTEYRDLVDKFDDLEIFTIGSNTAPFRLNPFQLFKDENISSRVDLIKASIEAAFDMEAAIPQLIEATIYRCYEDKGWNITTNENSKFTDPFAPDVDSFPIISDILRTVKDVATAQGFDARLQNDYIGSIKARLQSLTLGAKGLMLNCMRSIDFDELLDKKVVLELEELRDGGEKSLVIGFIMVNLMEAIKRRFEKDGNKKHPHITLIEEAHRLLSKPQPGDTNKQHGVETFTDMLAEIRKYGEGLIIADQIPNKLTPEVLKNTNIKIVHRLFAQDDKDAIGNTMSLSEEQRNFLSNLPIGRAIVFNGNWSKAVQVKMKNLADPSEEEKKKRDKKPLTRDFLTKRNISFYTRRWKSGIIYGSLVFGNKEPTADEMKALMLAGSNPDYKKALLELKERKDAIRLDRLLEFFKIIPDREKAAEIIARYYFFDSSLGKELLKAIDGYQEGKPLGCLRNIIAAGLTT